MIFGVALLVAGFFAWLGSRLGFYGSWILLWNLVLSAYMGVFLTPMLVALIPQAAAAQNGYALTAIGVFAATLLLAYGISIAVLRGRLIAEFDWAWDTFGGGLLGFLAGFLACGFWAFSLCLTPYAQTDSCKRLGLDVESQRATLSYVTGWCGMLHFVVSSTDAPLTARQAVTALLDEGSAPVVGAYMRTGSGEADPATPGTPADEAPAVDPPQPAMGVPRDGGSDPPPEAIQPGGR